MRVGLLLVALGGCADRPCVLVRTDGVDLPVCVEGDADSEQILLHLPGGPSAVGGWLYTRYGVRQELTDDFLVASTDYRSMGASKGVFARSRVTVAQLAADTNAIVEALHALHPDKEVWLHGHSFGGAVGTAALLAEPLADGWISEAGCHDVGENDPFTQQRLAAHVPVSDDPEVLESWATVQEEVVLEDPSTLEGHVRINVLANLADDLLGLPYVDNAEQGTLAWAAEMPFQLVQVGLPGSSANALLAEDLLGLHMASELDRIEVPALYLAGEVDFICTREHAASARESIGSERSELVVFEGGHGLADQFPVEVADAIRAFVRP